MAQHELRTGDTHRASPMPPSLQPEPPHWSLWYVYLVFRPRLFFETFVIQPTPALTAVAAWIYGLTAVIDRLETRLFVASDRDFYTALSDDWLFYWLFVMGMGVLSGVFVYAIGGWWYRLRLRWSGATDPDEALARRVYLFSAQAYAVPVVVYTVWETAEYASPAAAIAGDDLGWLFVIAGLCWSIYVSYRGARTAFVLRTWLARLWFFVLPGLLYAVVLFGAAGAVFFSSEFESAPALDDPRRIERPGYSLSYPGNWSIDSTDPDYDPDRNFSISPGLADAIILFWFYDSPMDSQECVDVTLQDYSESFEITGVVAVESWGGFEGAGYRAKAIIEGGDYDFFAFCSTDRERPFEVARIVEQAAVEKLRPGYDLIRDSFTLRP